jgi:hypothetical protein
VIDKILYDLDNGWQGVSIVAGYLQQPCVPSYCCTGNDIKILKSSCVNAPRGYQSDHFLFSLLPGRTYMMKLPLITTEASHGYNSTLHQVRHLTLL